MNTENNNIMSAEDQKKVFDESMAEIFRGHYRCFLVPDYRKEGREFFARSYYDGERDTRVAFLYRSESAAEAEAARLARKSISVKVLHVEHDVVFTSMVHWHSAEGVGVFRLVDDDGSAKIGLYTELMMDALMLHLLDLVLEGKI